jgi:hypothetical protein
MAETTKVAFIFAVGGWEVGKQVSIDDSLVGKEC